MMAYVLIALLSILIFLCFSDVVEVITEAMGQWERARNVGRHAVRYKEKKDESTEGDSSISFVGAFALCFGSFGARGVAVEAW